MNNYSYNLSGTQTGRYRSDKPNLQNLPYPSYAKTKYPDFRNIFKSFHQSYPSVSAFHHYTIYEIMITNSIHQILATPPVPKFEWKDWGSKYKWDFSDFNTVTQISNPKAPQAPQAPQVVVMGKPIDLIPLESFQVEVNFPIAGVPTTCDVVIDFNRFLDGHLIRPVENACKCEMRTLMRAGCQCGGQ